MRRRTVWLLATLVVTFARNNLAQTAELGRAVFRSNCAFCHGATGKGGRGPSLASSRMAAASDPDIRAIIRNGVPGTNMPAFSNLDKEDLDPLVLYVKSLANSGATTTAIHGDAAAGRVLYVKNGCGTCHRVGNEGGIYGPDLSRVGSGRSIEYLRESIVAPSADVPQEFEGVAVTTASGKTVKGIRINEDTFTVQLRTIDGKFATFDKTAAKNVEHPKDSFMPAYRLPEKDLNNLLAYLESLRGPVQTGADAEKAKGIK